MQDVDSLPQSVVDYWQEYLAGAPSVHTLTLDGTADRTRSAKQAFCPHTLTGLIDGKLQQKVAQLAISQGVKIEQFLATVFALMLHRYDSFDDIVVISLVKSNHLAVLPVRYPHLLRLSFSQYIKQCSQPSIDKAVPWEALHHRPISQFMVSFNQPIPTQLKGLDIALQMTELDKQVAGIELKWLYDNTLLSAQTIERFNQHFIRLLTAIVDDVDSKIAQLPMLTEQEVEFQCQGLNQCVDGALTASYPKKKTISQLFESVVTAHPEQVALVYKQRQVTYVELNQQANRLAHYLRSKGVESGAMVGICFERSIDMVVAILAILKAGAAYVPIDANYPSTRIGYMLKDTALNVLLSQTDLVAQLDEKVSVLASDIEVCSLDDNQFLALLNEQSDDNLASQQLYGEQAKNEQVACVFYTSGTTGHPKGVLIPELGIVRLAINANHHQLGPQNTMLMFASIAFDAATYELWISLLNGARLVIYHNQRIDVNLLNDLIRAHQVSNMFMTTGLFEQWSETACDMPSLNWIGIGGQVIAPDAIATVQAQLPQALVTNFYGPTENTTMATFYPVKEKVAQNQAIPIGKTVSGSSVYVLSPEQALLPQGCVGELYVGGDGVAKGYLNQPQLTKKAFIDNPFGEGRLYRTGDMVRILPCGNLAFVGRDDNQVKIRGFRIELAEIEQQLLACDLVHSTHVLAHEAQLGNKQLVAYIRTKAADEHPLAEIKAYLKGQLPQYMLPSAYVLVDEWPLTINGKTDLKALPVPDKSDVAQQQYTPPVTPMEQKLVAIWSELLQIPQQHLGTNVSFFELGGHSLLCVRLVGKIRAQLAIAVSIDDVFTHPTIASQARFIEQGQPLEPQDKIIPITGSVDKRCLSFAQSRMWFIDRLQDGSANYNLPMAYEVEGEFCAATAEKALNLIIERHEILRTVYHSSGKDGSGKDSATKVLPPRACEFEVVDLTAFTAEQKQQKVQQYASEDAERPFDLSSDLMLRGCWLQLVNDENGQSPRGILLLNLHHIAADGWSMWILMAEFSTFYRALINQQAPQLAPLALQYSDYAYWQQTNIQTQVLTQQRHYWINKLDGAPIFHGLNLDFERPLVHSDQGEMVSGLLDVQLTEQIQRLANDNYATTFMVLHAAFALLLTAHSNTTDIVIGTPVANRMHPEVEPLIGFFVNTLVLRSDSKDSYRFTDFLAHIRKVNIEAQNHQDIPFEQLVDALNVPRTNQYNPLFQIMLSNNTNEQAQLQLDGMVVNELSGQQLHRLVKAKFDLELDLNACDRGIELNWTFASCLFKSQTIELFNQHFVTLLKAIVANSQLPISQLSMLSEQERSHLLVSLNDSPYSAQNLAQHSPSAIDSHTRIGQRFTAQAQSSPDNLALSFGHQSLSYRELNQQVNQLSHYLLAQGIGVNCVVGICVNRCVDIMVALLAVLKVGGTYVPLDPKYPQSRLQYMIADTGLSYLVGHHQLIDNLAKQSDVSVNTIALDLQKVQSQLAKLPTAEPKSAEPKSAEPKSDKSGHLAYIIYTSGSTGKPKGVMVSHQGLASHIDNTIKAFDFTAKDRVLQFASFSFDTFVEQAFATICSGAGLCLIGEDFPDTREFFELVEHHQISITDLPVSYFAQLLATSSSLDWRNNSLMKIVLGGDAVSTEIIRQWFAKGANEYCQLYNAYGPTEAVVTTTIRAIDEADKQVVRIGQVFGERKIYVLDSHQRLCPFSCIGELFIGGHTLAEGYLNREDLTAKVFVDDPFSEQDNACMYRTGDLVRFLADDQLEFVGRVDEQVKIRGYRIELGEIEQQLEKLSQVCSSLVIAYQDDNSINGDKYIVAYIQPDKPVDDQLFYRSELKTHLSQQLPEYMMPLVFILVEQWPLTPNGKIDRKALPQPDKISAQGRYIAPTTETERQLVDIWSEVLELDAQQISISSNFFDLGGHSLLSMRLIARIRHLLGVEVAIKAIFEAPTIAQLAVHIEHCRGVELRSIITSRPIEQIDPNCIELSNGQQRMWYLDQLQQGSANYNMPMAYKVVGDFNIDIAEQALTQIIIRHQVLHTVYRKQDNGDVHGVLIAPVCPLTRVDLSALNVDEKPHQLQQLIDQHMSQVFDLSQDIMLKACWITLDEQGDDSKEGVLILNVHHIASDGWSLGVLMAEFVTLYQDLSSGQSPQLNDLAIAYSDFALWQNQYLQTSAQIQAQMDYWRAQLDQAPMVHSLPLDFDRKEQSAFKGDIVKGHLSDGISSRLTAVSQQFGVTPFMFLHSVFALLLYRHSNQADIVLGTSVDNRLQSEVEPLIGFFVNTLVLRTRCNGHVTFSDYLSHVKQVNLDALTHQDVPFDVLVEHLKIPRSSQYLPLFQILFSLDSNELPELPLSDVQTSPLSASSITAKFDLALDCSVTSEGIDFAWTYDTGIFKSQTITRLNRHFCTLLTAVLKDPFAPMAQLPILTAQETHHLLVQLNNTDRDYQQQLLLHELFSAQAERTPQNIAVCCDGNSLTYGQLEKRSNQLAHFLQNKLQNKQQNQQLLIGVGMTRSIDMVIGVMAVLKAGCGYVSLDPSYPTDRIEHMIKDSDIGLILTQSKLVDTFTGDNRLCLAVNELISQLDDYPDTAPQNPHQMPDSLAYLIYTSGSTGLPKGVMIEHCNVVAFIHWSHRYFSADLLDCVLFSTSLNFDLSIFELFSPLCMGGSTYVVDNILALIDKQQQPQDEVFQSLSLINTVPSGITALLQAEAVPQSVSTINLAGEPLKQALVNQLLALPTVKRVNNLYGPSEDTTYSTVMAFTESLDSDPLIGKPIDNTRAYVLNDEGQLLPLGVTGELYLGGHNLSRGYLNQPQLTAEKFIANPFASELNQGHERLYKTGDLVRFMPDGNLMFMGRADAQVKIRGFRIELGEIEQQLNHLDSIQVGLVKVAERDNDLYLVAYIEMAEPADEADFIAKVKQKLSKTLPAHMIPTAFVVMSEWPLTTNGKIDKKALPEPDNLAVQGEYIAPSTDTEIKLVAIWAKLLNLPEDKISISSDFFELGGHSLLATRLATEIVNLWSIKVNLRDILENQNIVNLGKLIDQKIADEQFSTPAQVVEKTFDEDDDEDMEEFEL